MAILLLLAPVFLIVALGAALQRSRFAPAGFFKDANRLTYWVALPALLFSELVGAPQNLRGAGVAFVVMLVATGLVVVLGYLLAAVLRVPATSTGTFVQACFRGNLAFIGLPLIYLMPEVPLAGGMSTWTAAVLIVAPMTVVYNIVGTVVLLLSHHALNWRIVRPLAKQLATNPPLLATLAAVGLVIVGWAPPPAITKTCRALGAMALPLGLLGVGASLFSQKLVGSRGPMLGCAFVKTVASPLCALGVAAYFGLHMPEAKVVLILMACPTAILSYSMAVEMKGDEALASGAIVLSTFASMVALAQILMVF